MIPNDLNPCVTGTYDGIFYGVEGSKGRKYYQHLLNYYAYRDEMLRIRTE